MNPIGFCSYSFRNNHSIYCDEFTRAQKIITSSFGYPLHHSLSYSYALLLVTMQLSSQNDLTWQAKNDAIRHIAVMAATKKLTELNTSQPRGERLSIVPHINARESALRLQNSTSL